MKKPFAEVTNPLAAPSEDMEEIVIATLNSLQFGKFTYVDSPKGMQASREDAEIWADKTHKRAYAVELTWSDDPNPPPAFENLAMQNEFIQALIVNLKVKDLKLDSKDDAIQIAKEILTELIERAQKTSEAAKQKKKPTDHGTAAWATLQELSDEDYVQEETKEDPSTRLLIGSYKNKTISVPQKFTEAHAIVAGPPGVGKSRTIFIPNLIERIGTSAIVTEVVAGEDVMPTVFSMTAGYRKAQGHKVFYLNPADLNNSTRFNPLDFINGIDDAIYYASLIITNTTEKKHIGDQIWTQSETHLLTALLLYVWGLGGKTKSQEGGMANLGHIRELLRHGPTQLNKLITSNGIADARNRFDEFIRNSSPNFRLGVFSGLIQRLNSWLNPKLIALTEVSDFSEEDLRNNLFTFYLAYPVNRPDYKPIMALALNFLTKLALRKKFDKPLTLLLDEFAAYGTIPGIDDLQATIRNRNIGIVLGFQDQEQLEGPYTKAQANVLFTNTDTKILFATGALQAQKQISQMLGQETRVKKQVSSSGHITKQTVGAALLSPGEIGTQIKVGQVLVIRNKRNPLIAQTSDPGKYNAYQKNYPAPEKPKKKVNPAVFDQVELAAQLEFSELEGNKQIDHYKKLWSSKKQTQEALEEAKAQGLSAAAIQSLEKQLEAAQLALDKFVAPEGPAPIPVDPEDKEPVKPAPKPAPAPAPKPAPTPAPQPVVDDKKNKPLEANLSSISTIPVTDPPNLVSEPPAPELTPQEEQSDPFEEHYDNDDNDPYQDFYDETETGKS